MRASVQLPSNELLRKERVTAAQLELGEHIREKTEEGAIRLD